MRRVASVWLLIGSLAALMGIGLVLLPPLSEAGADSRPTAPPTNTLRPTIPPTNTPRATPTFLPTATSTPVPTLTPSDTPTPVPSPTPTATIVGPNEYPDNFNPLTGLPYPNEAARDRRNLIVKVSNFPEVVRPQSGLDKADIVIEYEVEGGVTRFAAIYRSEGSDHVGSIRSARLLDLELVPMFQALLAYSGSNEWIKDYILNADWKWRALSPQLGVNCPPFCRFEREGLAYEHTLFGNTFQMWDEAEKRQVNDGMQVRGFAWSDVPDPDGEPAMDISIKYYNDRQSTRWQYNPQDGRYYRWNTGLPHVDAVTGKQLAADNVVILSAEHVNRPDVYESEVGGIAVDILLWGHGDAWIFRDGLWFKGEWWHSQGRSGLFLMYPGGEIPIHLKPGQTWIEIVRSAMWGVDIQAEPVDAVATAESIYATQTGVAAETATAIAPYITPSPVPPTPTPNEMP